MTKKTQIDVLIAKIIGVLFAVGVGGYLLFGFLSGNLKIETTPDPIIRHLPWATGTQLTPTDFYGALKIGVENRGAGRVSRDGSDFTIRTDRANCNSAMADLEPTIPNGVSLECKDGSWTVWKMDRK